MGTNATSIRPTHGQHRQPNALRYGHSRPAAIISAGGVGGLNTRGVRRGPGPVRRGSLGTAPIQKPPSGAFYQAGEYCPQVDLGKTTQDSTGRTLIGRFNNGLRWQYR